MIKEDHVSSGSGLEYSWVDALKEELDAVVEQGDFSQVDEIH
jgi:hypothetical protein